MPRKPRTETRGEIHHVLNRGNHRATLFHDETDYSVFLDTLKETKAQIPIRIYAFATMSNHFHLVVQPNDIDTLSRFIHRWMTKHAARRKLRHGGGGHIWQGRFKAFPIQGDEHFLTVVRYVLLNPVRAGLVQTPKEYLWSSMNHQELIDRWPVPKPHTHDWLERPIHPSELKALRTSVNRQIAFGSPAYPSPPPGTGPFKKG